MIRVVASSRVRFLVFGRMWSFVSVRIPSLSALLGYSGTFRVVNGSDINFAPNNMFSSPFSTGFHVVLRSWFSSRVLMLLCCFSISTALLRSLLVLCSMLAMPLVLS